MADIETPTDVALIIDQFYTKALVDPEISYLFKEVVQLSWDKHIPLINAFWTSILLGSGDYKGNPMVVHMELNKKKPLTRAHFERWISLWTQTVEGLYAGPKATEAISRARSIAGIMQVKLGLVGPTPASGYPSGAGS